MRTKSIKNVTNGRVHLRLANGMSAYLPPGSKVENLSITNEKELKGKVLIVKDLTEVVENSGKTRLDD